MPSLLASFDRFAAKARGPVPVSFVVAKAIRVGVDREELAHASDETLVQEHLRGMEELRAITTSDDRGAALVQATGEDKRASDDMRASLLDVKLERARRLLRPCTLCALECRVDRRAGPAGACGLGSGLGRYLDFLHEGEEPEISPTHAILLAGCNYRCAYCSDWAHVEEPARDPLTATSELARSIEARRAAGAASLSWIGGEPGVNLPGILEALALARTSVPVVWNSNMHSTEAVRDLLEGVVDAYVADLKHGNDACALEVARVPDYLAVVLPAIQRASREAFTIVRHLVMPGHVECCTLPALEAIARELPGVRTNLMAQYRPNGNVRGTPLDRRPTANELETSAARARELGLDLEPRGQLVGPAPVAPPAAGKLAFESSIFFDPDGSVTIENLSPELREVAEELGLLQKPDA